MSSSAKNDKVILDLKKEIEAKKKLLAKNSKFNPITNCSLKFENLTYNLHVINKQTILYLVAKLTALKTALYLQLPDETLEIDGFSVDDWLTDLINKFNLVNVSIEKEKLTRLENQLHSLLTTETKVELELDDIKKQILS